MLYACTLSFFFINVGHGSILLPRPLPHSYSCIALSLSLSLALGFSLVSLSASLFVCLSLSPFLSHCCVSVFFSLFLLSTACVHDAKTNAVIVTKRKVDPMEPPKHKHKKVPRAPADDPVPVLHSPPRKVRHFVLCIPSASTSSGS